MSNLHQPRAMAIMLALAFTCCACENAPNGAPPEAATTWQHPRTPWGEPDLSRHVADRSLDRRAAATPRGNGQPPRAHGRRARRAPSRVRGPGKEPTTKRSRRRRWASATGSNGAKINRLTSLIVDPQNGQLPALTQEGERRRALMHSGWMTIPFDTAGDFDNWERCIMRGRPASMLPATRTTASRSFSCGVTR